jgi:hypothetical protein
MAFTTCSVATNNIASLDDLPNDVGGLTAAQLKAKFDQFGADFVAWFNATHIAEADAHLDSKAPHPNVPAARVTHSVAQSIANSIPTFVSFDTERFDNDVIHDVLTNNTRLTCKTAGKYLIIGAVSFAVNNTGQRVAHIKLNGSTIIGFGGGVALVGDYTPIVVSTIYNLAVNDYVELQVTQTSGGALDIVKSNPYSPEFMMVRVG